MRQYIRKADVILLIALVIVGLAISAVLAMHAPDSGSDSIVVIKSGGNTVSSSSLSEDAVLKVPTSAGSMDTGNDISHRHYNIVTIKGGKVSVTESSCKNQVCVRHGAVSRPGENIVCLPNRLIVSIEGGKDKGGGYDSISS